MIQFQSATKPFHSSSGRYKWVLVREETDARGHSVDFFTPDGNGAKLIKTGGKHAFRASFGGSLTGPPGRVTSRPPSAPALSLRRTGKYWALLCLTS